MSRGAQIRLTGSAIAVALLLWWTWAQPFSGEKGVGETTVPLDVRAAAGSDPERPAPRLDEPLDRRPTLSSRSIRVLQHDGFAVGAGSLYCLAESPELEPEERMVRVQDGLASMPEDWTDLDAAQQADWLFQFEDGTPARVREAKVLEQGDVELTLWPPRTSTIRVVDLAGTLLAESRLKVFERHLGWIDLGPAQVPGFFVVAWHGPQETVVAEASAPGHASRRAVISESGPEPAQLALPALLFLALLAPDWPNVAVATGADSERLKDSSDAAALAGLRASTQALLPSEQWPWVRFHLWEEMDLKARESEVEVFVVELLDPDRQTKLSFRPQLLLDSAPALHVLEYSDLLATDPCHPFELILDSLAAWTPEELPFIEILLRGVSTHSPGQEWFARAHAKGNGRFAGFAPEGRYEVLGVPPERRWHLDDAPRIQGGTMLSITATAVASTSLVLEPGETYAAIRFTTLLGGSTASGILLAPSDGRARRVIPPLDQPLVHRFLRPGEYDLWYYDYSAHETRRLMECLRWAGSSTDRAEWRIVLPRDVFGTQPDVSFVPRTP